MDLSKRVEDNPGFNDQRVQGFKEKHKGIIFCET